MRTFIIVVISLLCIESFAASFTDATTKHQVKTGKNIAQKRVVKKKIAKGTSRDNLNIQQRTFPPPGSSGDEKNSSFYAKRAFPYEYIQPEWYTNALEQARRMPVYKGSGSQFAQADMTWQNLGPKTIGGRVTSIATHPTDSNLFYAGAASGGLWKTTDHGTSWQSLTDTFATLPVGYVTLDPHNPNVIYLGLGECNNSADSYPGNGIWRSIDAGQSWTSLGLTKTQYIVKIIVDPKDSNIIYVAAPGPSAAADSNRGVWKSVDHGTTWQRVFLLRAGTAKTSTPVPVCDLVMNPTDNNDLIACMWDNHSTNGGNYTGLWRTKDAGTSWKRIDTLSTTYPNGEKLKRLSRGVLLWANTPGAPTLYSVTTKIDTNAVTKFASDDNLFGVYKTQDPEGAWTKVIDSSFRIPYMGNNVDSADFFYRQGSYDIFIVGHPTRPNEVYIGGIDVIRTTNGGNSWNNITHAYPHYFNNDRSQHSDQHALTFTAAKNGDDLLNGSDGGVFSTRDYGLTWTQMKGVPITMFYQLEPWEAGMQNLGASFPADSIKLIGGTQDNGTIAHGFSANTDWDWVNRGDGGFAQTHPTNKSYLITSLQLGKIFVRTTLDSLRPNLFSDNGKNDPNTKKWFDLSVIAKRRGIADSSEPCSFIPPVVLDKQRPNMLYSGRTRLYRTKIDYNDPDSGTIIQPWSPQLVGVLNSPKSWLYGGDIEAIALGPADATGRPMIWAGGISATKSTDGSLANGLTCLYRTTYNPTLHPDSSPTWIKVITGLPFAIPSSVVADRSDSLTAFVGMTSYSAAKHIYKTVNGGKNWASISGNLPNAPLSAIIIDSLAEQGNPLAKNQCIIVAMDVGVFVTTDGGKTWAKLGTGMPNVVVNHITMYKNWLIASTHGRSAWALDVSSLKALPTSTVYADKMKNSSIQIESLRPNPLTFGGQNRKVTIDLRSLSTTTQFINVDLISIANGTSTHFNPEVTINGDLKQVQLELSATLASGTYVLRISDSQGGHDEKQFVVIR